MSRKTFVNLPVKDLSRSMTFFQELGFAFDPKFTDDKAACMIISDDSYAMLLHEDFFKTFNNKKSIVDATTATEAIISIDAGSRAEVDALADKALSAGATPGNPPIDEANMYDRSVQDPDGHLWEFFYMDMEGMQASAGTA